MRLKAFVGFDGTNALFRRFGGEACESLIRAYREEHLSAVACFRAAAAAVGRVARQDLLEFIDRQPIDPEFAGFVRFCRERDIELTVLSDGLDLYIRRILAAHDLHDLRVVANHARLADEGDAVELHLEFPHTNAECSRCACCKRNAMLTGAGEDDITVFVGEGYSDRCPARYADIVFARGELQRFCQEENISYYLYATFGDVVSRLDMVLRRKRLRKRTAAEHLRREAFTAE